MHFTHRAMILDLLKMGPKPDNKGGALEILYINAD